MIFLISAFRLSSLRSCRLLRTGHGTQGLLSSGSRPYWYSGMAIDKMAKTQCSRCRESRGSVLMARKWIHCCGVGTLSSCRQDPFRRDDNRNFHNDYHHLTVERHSGCHPVTGLLSVRFEPLESQTVLQDRLAGLAHLTCLHFQRMAAMSLDSRKL